jgi:hypothetical protein
MTNHRHQSQLYIHEVVKLFRLIISNRKLTIIRVAVVRVSVCYIVTRACFNRPVGIVHANRFFVFQHARPMRHHTWFVQGRLSVENEHVSITQMSKHLLIDSRGSCGELSSVSTAAFLRCEQLIGNSSSLFYCQFFLCIKISMNPSSSMRDTK